jgi:hypothetical protein
MSRVPTRTTIHNTHGEGRHRVVGISPDKASTAGIHELMYFRICAESAVIRFSNLGCQARLGSTRWVPAAAAVALDSVLNALAAGRYPDSFSVRFTSTHLNLEETKNWKRWRNHLWSRS